MDGWVGGWMDVGTGYGLVKGIKKFDEINKGRILKYKMEFWLILKKPALVNSKKVVIVNYNFLKWNFGLIWALSF